jgi:Leucine-rich repeat (LRR) protein
MAVDIERLEKEKNALKELYDSTIGNGWKNETNWDFSTPVTNDWYGITVDNNGYVISIILVDNNLDGHIPTEIGDFSSLGLLALNKNRKLRGVIPEPIGLLSQLTYLGIYECGLSGPLPDVFDGLSNINDGVFLFDNDINGVIPESFSSLKKCQVLRLEENELEGEISSAIGDMDNLQYLYLFENNLSGVLPNNLGQLTHLVSLKLSENSFGGNIPDFIYNLGSLSNLHLDHNRFDGNISNRLSELTNLTELKLSHNRFT